MAAAATSDGVEQSTRLRLEIRGPGLEEHRLDADASRQAAGRKEREGGELAGLYLSLL